MQAASARTGLGRGRGFAVTDRYSVLDEPLITGLISDRCHRILHMINDQRYLPPGEVEALRALLEKWINYSRMLESKNSSPREEREEETFDDEYEYDEGYIERLLERINRETNFHWEDLEEAIEFLLGN